MMPGIILHNGAALGPLLRYLRLLVRVGRDPSTHFEALLHWGTLLAQVQLAVGVVTAAARVYHAFGGV